MTYTFSPLSDDAVVMQFGTDIHLSTHQKIQNVATYLQEHPCLLYWVYNTNSHVIKRFERIKFFIVN